jgi:hypothetical protein
MGACLVDDLFRLLQPLKDVIHMFPRAPNEVLVACQVSLNAMKQGNIRVEVHGPS